MKNKKLNLKKLCPLLGLCISVFAAMPTVLADPPPKRQLSIAVPAMPDVPGALNPGHQPARQFFPFTPEEDAIIIDHVAQYGPKKWAMLESRIPNHRYQAFRERWYNYLNPEINHNPWTDEEDQILLDKVNEFGRRWTQIAQFIPGRTNHSVQNRWILLNRQRPGPKARVPWTPEEDKIILNKFNELGRQWTQIAQFLPGRSVGGVHKRWDILNIRGNGPKVYVPWTPEEDKILLNKYNELGPQWTKIVQFLPGRTGPGVQSRWDILNKQATGPKARVPWTPEEDAILLDKYNELGRQWTKIAQFLPGRIGTSVQGRWEILNNPVTDPKVHVPWTPEEDEILINKFNELGRQWTQIAQFLPGRSVGGVHKRWERLNNRDMALNASSDDSEQDIAPEQQRIILPPLNFNATQLYPIQFSTD